MPGSRRGELRSTADEELMTLVIRGDADAFEVLYDRHVGAAYSLAYRVVGDQHQAEDVTQEALVSIWRSGRAIRPGSGQRPRLDPRHHP